MRQILAKEFLVIALGALLVSHGQATEAKQAKPQAGALPVRIGVLAEQGKAMCLAQWGPTGDYLSNHMQEYSFTIVPLDFEEVKPAVAAGEVDFILANPSLLVELEHFYGVNAIATFKNKVGELGLTQIAGVLFCRADRNDMRDFPDLKGHSFMAVEENSFGGWQMAWREFVELGIDPYRDFTELSFGGTNEGVIQSVLQGEVDAGTVRSGALEQMAQKGLIDLNDFRVLNEVECRGGFPLKHSTRHYPEWGISSLQGTPVALAEKVCWALTIMGPECPAASAAQSMGWSLPLSYDSVMVCMRILGVGAAAHEQEWNLWQVIKPLAPFLIAAAILILVIVQYGFLLAYRNRQKLGQTEDLLRRSELRVELAMEASNIGMFEYDLVNDIFKCNEIFQQQRGFHKDEDMPLAAWVGLVHPEDRQKLMGSLQAVRAGKVQAFDATQRAHHSDGHWIWTRIMGRVIEQDENGRNWLVAGTSLDITEQISTEVQLRHSQKMESIGQLAAGIAHEINTPIQYVGDNTRFLKEASTELLSFTRKCRAMLTHPGQFPDLDALYAQLGAALQEADVEYLEEELPRAIAQSLDGVERVAGIVRAMKEFSHPTQEMANVDLNKAIASTVTVARNEWKYVAELETDFDANLPNVTCQVGDINQAILNMIVNAAHAIADVIGDQEEGKGTIRISTRHDGNWVEIKLMDTGKGMDEETVDKIFDPFFTTKEVGKGTGQGLSLAHTCIVKKHGGSITCDSKIGQGTEFTIRLPIQPAGTSDVAVAREVLA